MLRATATFVAMLLPVCVSAAELVVQIGEVRNAKGHIRVALFDSADGFLQPDGPIAAISVPSKKGELKVRFSDIAPGRYAVALFHDENGNSELDSNLIGVPIEGTAFSRDVKASFGPPDFEDAAVQIQEGEISVTSANVTY